MPLKIRIFAVFSLVSLFLVGALFSALSFGGLVSTTLAYADIPPHKATTDFLLQAPKNTRLAFATGGSESHTVDKNALKWSGGISEGTENTSQRRVLATHTKKQFEYSYYIHKVKEGNTLSEIADKYGVTTNTVRWANHIAPDEYIYPGQLLIILPVSGVSYTIQEEDTLSSIAEKYGVSMDGILQYNRVSDPSVITPGKKIIVPNGKKSQKIRNAGGSRKSGASAPQVSSARAAVSPYTAPRSSGGYFTAPLDHYIKTQGIHGHNGVDLAAPVGTPIYAAADGVVSRMYNGGGWNGGYGNDIVLNHANGTATLYSHMRGVRTDNVAVGKKVSQGEVIGYVGLTGRTTGPHLHFEVRGGINPF